jgi:DNA-3-methyladenine glycosylase II
MALRRSTRIQTTAVAEPIITLQNHISKAKDAPRVSKKRTKPGLDEAAGAASAQDDSTQSDNMPPPITPINKRRKQNDDSEKPLPSPYTPTPAAIGLMLGKAATRKRKPATTTSDDPTHVPLLTPNGTILEPVDPPLLTIPLPAPTSPSSPEDTLLNTACAHLISIDSTLAPLIAAHKCHLFTAASLSRPIDPFRALASGIIAQQISGKAASSIQTKFIALFPATDCTISANDEDSSSTAFPTPTAVAAMPLPTLRTAGLSQRKAEYISGLASKFVTGALTPEMLLTGTDEEILANLVAVRGLGTWSVEMFMCFALKRMDVFSRGDLGVQRGVAAYCGRDVKRLKTSGKGKEKYISEREMVEVAGRFRPYRWVSLFFFFFSSLSPFLVIPLVFFGLAFAGFLLELLGW